MFFCIISLCGGGQAESRRDWSTKRKTIREQEQRDGRGRQKMGQAAQSELLSFQWWLPSPGKQSGPNCRVMYGRWCFAVAVKPFFLLFFGNHSRVAQIMSLASLDKRTQQHTHKHNSCWCCISHSSYIQFKLCLQPARRVQKMRESRERRYGGEDRNSGKKRDKKRFNGGRKERKTRRI